MDPNQNQNIQTPTAQAPGEAPGQGPLGAGTSTPPLGTVPPPPGTPMPPPPTGQSPVTGGPAPVQMPGDSAPKSGSKMLIFIVVGILLLIILGFIYFMAAGLATKSETKVESVPTRVPTPTLTPTPTPLSEKDIDTIDLGNPETDLKGIDEDVKQL